MSDLSPELNLALAVDDDDTADYLAGVDTSLRSSLLVLDGQFNSGTGHAHNGAHQGGALQFLDLTVGEDLTVTGASDLHGSVHMYSNLTVDGAATVAGLTKTNTLEVTSTSLLRGGVTMQAGLNVLGTATLSGGVVAAGDVRARFFYTDDGSNGAVYGVHGNLYLRPPAGNQVICDSGPLAVAQWISAGSYVSAGAPLSSTPGDLSSNRGSNTGYCFLGNGSHYVGFDGANYQMPASNLYVNGDLVVLVSNVLTLNNKTLQDPKLLGQTTLGGGSFTFPTVSGNAGMWRYVKAWGGNMTILLTNGTFILGGTQYSSGQYVLTNGDSVSTYCDGSNWWVI
jgi:hypothetical protein